ncbi:MAG: glycosyltransferase family 9 protein [Ignavibacteriaceae bacterium]|nr:glycosyltransferase family 9 protein [Ignavibacteriaceae bacterium]
MKALKSIERFGKKLLTALVKFFIKKEVINVADLNPLSVKRVIIVHLDRKIGNLILTTPLIENSKRVFSNAAVDILVAHQVKALLESNPFLANIFEFNHARFIKNPFNLFQLILLLRRRKYNVAIESSNPAGTSFLNGIITYLTKAKYKIGFSGGGGELFTNLHITPDNNNHYYISKQELVNLFSKEKIFFKPKIFTDINEVKTHRKNIFEKFNIKDEQKFIGIWIGARDKKKWDIENFKSIYEKIKIETDYFPILLFGIEETDEYSNIEKKKYNAILFNDLRELKYFISCCNLFISGDTGPLHYAYALGISTIGIFLQENYDTYGYSDDRISFVLKPDKYDVMIKEAVNICKSLEIK